MYRTIAAQIYIIGIHGIVEGKDPEVRDIRESMYVARSYFRQNCPEGFNENFPNESIWKKYNTAFNLSEKWFESIYENFQSVLQSLGEIASG